MHPNQTAEFLESLKEQYKNNPQELAKISAIGITSGSIVIAGVEIKTSNEEAEEDWGQGIFKNEKGDTLWTWKSAMVHAEKQLGFRCLNNIEWGEIFDAIPGKSDNAHTINAISLLNLPLSGYRDIMGETVNVGWSESIWTSFFDKDLNLAYYWYVHKDKNGRLEPDDPNCVIGLRLARKRLLS